MSFEDLYLIYGNSSFDQAVRPKLSIAKSFEDAAVAVDEMFSSALQNAGRTCTSNFVLVTIV